MTMYNAHPTRPLPTALQTSSLATSYDSSNSSWNVNSPTTDSHGSSHVHSSPPLPRGAQAPSPNDIPRRFGIDIARHPLVASPNSPPSPRILSKPRPLSAPAKSRNSDLRETEYPCSPPSAFKAQLAGLKNRWAGPHSKSKDGKSRKANDMEGEGEGESPTVYITAVPSESSVEGYFASPGSFSSSSCESAAASTTAEQRLSRYTVDPTSTSTKPLPPTPPPPTPPVKRKKSARMYIPFLSSTQSDIGHGTSTRLSANASSPTLLSSAAQKIRRAQSLRAPSVPFDLPSYTTHPIPTSAVPFPTSPSSSQRRKLRKPPHSPPLPPLPQHLTEPNTSSPPRARKLTKRGHANERRDSILVMTEFLAVLPPLRSDESLEVEQEEGIRDREQQQEVLQSEQLLSVLSYPNPPAPLPKEVHSEVILQQQQGLLPDLPPPPPPHAYSEPPLPPPHIPHPHRHSQHTSTSPSSLASPGFVPAPPSLLMPARPSFLRSPSNRRWTLGCAMVDGVPDEVIVAELERLRGQGLGEWGGPGPGSPEGSGGGSAEGRGAKEKERERRDDDVEWKNATRALLCCRELVRTERNYEARLVQLSAGETTTTPPALLQTYLPALLSASRALSACFAEDPSAWGVAAAFLGCGDELEKSLVAWCGVVGDLFSPPSSKEGSIFKDGFGMGGAWSKAPKWGKRASRVFKPGTADIASGSNSGFLIKANSGGDISAVSAHGQLGSFMSEDGHSVSSIMELHTQQTPRVHVPKLPLPLLPPPIVPPMKPRNVPSSWRKSLPSFSRSGLALEREEKEEREKRVREQAELEERRKRKRATVRELAIEPTQRVTRYVLLYRDLLEHTPFSSPSRTLVDRALEVATRIAQKCDRAQGNAAFLRRP